MPSLGYACSHCSGIHELGTRCPHYKRTKTKTTMVKIRNSGRWQRTREAIRARDKHLCQACLIDAHGTRYLYTHADMEVHHIVPLSEDASKSHDHANLITLCRTHHKDAHDGLISRQILLELAKRNNASITEGYTGIA